MKEVEQLCWSCSKAYGGKCEWMTLNSKHPKFVKINTNNFIVACENYEKENTKDKFTNKDLANLLGVSERTFYRNKKLYMQILENTNIKKEI